MTETPDVTAPPPPDRPWLRARLEIHAPFLAVLGSAMLLRFLLAYVAYPGQGFATDLDQFAGWASVLAGHGPSTFYATSGANYPPGYMYVLWLLGILSQPVGSVLGISSGAATIALLKLPPMLADAAIGILLYRAGRSWFGANAGLVAAALFLFLPMTWYDSALWGQVDSVGSLLMLASLLALADGWSEPSMALAVLGVLVKPQDAICLVVVIPVLVRRHLLRIGTGPVPRLGGRLAEIDRRLQGPLTNQSPVRLVSTVAVAAVVGIVPLLPFDIQTFAPADQQGNLFVGHVGGLLGLFDSVAGQFSVLTANAFNAWSLAGGAPLTAGAGSGGSWTADSMPVLFGLTAVQVGTGLLSLVGLTVAAGLLVRDDRRAILLGFAVAAFAFYAVPTRVHERYLFALWPAGALLVGSYGPAVAGYVATALLNTINLHAVLGSSQQIGGNAGGGGLGGGRLSGGGGLGGSGFAGGGFGGSGPGGGSGFGGSGFGGSGFGGSSGSATSISLPFTDIARSEPVLTAVAVGQTAAFLALLILWVGYAFAPLVRAVWRMGHPGAAMGADEAGRAAAGERGRTGPHAGPKAGPKSGPLAGPHTGPLAGPKAGPATGDHDKQEPVQCRAA